VKPQNIKLLALLRERGEAGVTPLEGLAQVGTLRLGARVHDLKAEGFHIDTELVTMPSGARVARYRLREQPAQLALPTPDDIARWRYRHDI